MMAWAVARKRNRCLGKEATVRKTSASEAMVYWIPSASESSLRRTPRRNQSLRSSTALFTACIACVVIVYKYMWIAPSAPTSVVSEGQDNDVQILTPASVSVLSIDEDRDGKSSALDSKCAAAVNRLVELNINILALDFDETMIDMHTGGHWKGTVTDLASHVRPVFLCLVPEATRRHVRVAIVTFSRQTDQIRKVLEARFPDEATIIPIRGCDKTWAYEGSCHNGKRGHIASVVEELVSGGDKASLTPLLIDDDPKNIKLSLRVGKRAIRFNPENPLQLLDDILLLN